MKKTLTIISIILTQTLLAQNEYPCNEEFSTDPNNPVNNQQNSFDPSVQHFLNSFNWFANDGVSSFNTIPYENMGPVFSGQSTGNFFSPFSSLGSSPYYDYLHQGGVDERDFYPEDGWELLSINLGYFPDLTTLPSPGSAKPEIPYIILYNKYKNVIRLFATTTTGLINEYDAVKVNLKFPAEISGLFNTISNETRSLDMPSQVTRVGMLTEHPDLSNSLTWFHVDFPVSYDPCGCYFKSDITFEFEFYSNANLILTGRSVSLTENLLDANGKPLDSYEFLSSIYNEPANPVDAGAVIYKRQTDLIDAYIAKLEAVRTANANNLEYNKKIKRYVTILNALKSVLIGAFTPVTIDILTHARDILGLDGLVDNDKVKELAKTILGSGFDGLKGMFKEKSKVAEPDMPKAVVTEMAFNGSITTQQLVLGPTMYNPGTYPNPSFSPTAEVNYELYPAYNNPLGSFALLNKPKIHKAIADVNLGDELLEISLGNSQLFNMREFHATYQIKEPIKYVFNPALDVNFNETKIYAALIVKAKTPFEFLEDGAGAEYCDVNHSNFSADVTTLDKGDLITEFVPIECFNEMISTIRYKHPNDYGALNLNADEGLLVNYDEDVYVRLMIDYVFNSTNSDGNPNTSLEVMTFPVEVITPNDFSVFSAFATSYDLNDFPMNLVLETQHFNTNTTIQAWNDITINGDITADNGVIVNIIAGNQIIVTPEGSVSPTGNNEINLTIQSILSCTSPIEPMDANYVHQFCNGLLADGNYMANMMEQMQMIAAPSIPTIHEIDLVVDLKDQNNFGLSSKNSTDKNQIFTLYDMTGKVLINQNNLPATVNLQSYSVGIYLIEYSTENGIARKKLYRN